MLLLATYVAKNKCCAKCEAIRPYATNATDLQHRSNTCNIGGIVTDNQTTFKQNIEALFPGHRKREGYARDYFDTFC